VFDRFSRRAQRRPVLSTTVPEILPISTWLNTERAESRKMADRVKDLFTRLISTLRPENRAALQPFGWRFRHREPQNVWRFGFC
jgi:hypothetical protein